MATGLFETDAALWELHSAGALPVSFEMEQIEHSMQQAREAKRQAYAPYSKFAVGAAILMNDAFYAGSNVENASYGATMCAERSAIFSAAGTGKRHLNLVAITTSAAADSPIESRSPCGMCRQVISEFAHKDTLIVLDAGDKNGKMTGEIFRFDDLLPHRFRLRG